VPIANLRAALTYCVVLCRVILRQCSPSVCPSIRLTYSEFVNISWSFH